MPSFDYENSRTFFPKPDLGNNTESSKEEIKIGQVQNEPQLIFKSLRKHSNPDSSIHTPELLTLVTLSLPRITGVTSSEEIGK